MLDHLDPSFRQRLNSATDALRPEKLLGFEAQRHLAAQNIRVSTLAYFEDDLIIHDPLFHKMRGLVDLANLKVWLVPQRYEVPSIRRSD